MDYSLRRGREIFGREENGGYIPNGSMSLLNQFHNISLISAVDSASVTIEQHL